MKETTLLNVYIVASHPLVIQQLKTVLGTDRSICAKLATETGNQRLFAPGVLLLDAVSAPRPLDQLVRESMARHHGSRVVVICGEGRPRVGLRAIEELGVHGWLDHSALAKCLIPTITAVAAGMYCLPGSEIPRRDMRTADLTIREKQVLELVRWRFSNREIAHKLRIRESTVKSHVRGVLTKLEATRQEVALSFDSWT